MVMAFASLEGEAARAAHEQALARRYLFDDSRAAFFGVSIDPADQSARSLADAPVGIRYFRDYDLQACAALGLIGQSGVTPRVFLIDRAFRVFASGPLEETSRLLDVMESELAREGAAADGFAPVLTLPRVFEPEFCRLLIDYFEGSDPEPSGFAADIDGRTQLVIDPALKRRHDVMVKLPALEAAIEARVIHRLLPMVKTAFNWRANYIERFLICRYSASDQGFFMAHRDDVVAGAAHRKFAVTINLNAEDFEGGDLRFPEFGRRAYRPPTGGATVFCCSLLHEVTPVTAGVRYAFVPFLFDEDGERIRQANAGAVA
jgi:hypothetical protein